MQEKLILWWQGRSPRERTILFAWGSAVTILLLWFAVLSPLLQRIATLEKRVPVLEAQLNKMRARPVENRRTQSAANPANGDLRSTLFGLLAERNVSAELRALSTARVEMRLPELPMGEVLELLDALRRETATRVAVMNVKTEAAGSAARVVVELERAP